jgi:hypothetical protein
MKLQALDVHKNKRIALQIGLLLGVSVLLRLADLGYSDFQGDEISALCKFSDFKTPLQFLAYLLSQRKGPVQYLLTCAFSILDPTFSSELAIRLPFALANLMALGCFFILVYRLFTLEIALYSSFLFATNGIFIAFARIVQYQSFVILGVVAAILGLTLALQDEKWKVPELYLGFLAAAIGLLAHFDAVFVLPPMALLVLHWWRNSYKRPDFARLRRHLIAAIALFAFLVLGFYIEYAMRLSSFQTDYWGERMSGESTDILRLFQFYNPGPVLWIYLGAVAIGLTRIRKSVNWQVLLAWLFPPSIFMVLVFQDSRTHAYTYLLPLLVVAGIGVDSLIYWFQQLVGERFSQITNALVLALLLLLSYIPYSIFVDHEPEYPWYPKRLLVMEATGGYLVGTFGFPYSRQWREIASWFESLPNQDLTLVTNEKLEIAQFYLPARVHYRYGRSEFPGRIKEPDGLYFLVIPGPQSWMSELWGWPLDKWHEKLVPLQNFLNEEGKLVASVYFLTQEQINTIFP